ncbi:hypothetical protein B0T11DRAFT_74252 [Plectosphaerella cucumerina]|jgi:hypothetical protein|uniref:Uncharacterized protein n=1 Tax=Plectosphaerella cucumerina TaxID=40658 RepID=A0A8K0TJI2_9PEZI|nr:hypothetical protein B0T11DRAFT_74252 [Plectosphaerella cucumerina]
MSAAVAAEKQNRPEDTEEGLPSPMPPMSHNNSNGSVDSPSPTEDRQPSGQDQALEQHQEEEEGQKTPTSSTALGASAEKKADRPRIRIKGQDAALRDEQPLSRHSSTRSTATITRPKIEIPRDLHQPAPQSSTDSGVTDTGAGRGRKESVSSLSFAQANNPKLPQGIHKKTDKLRIRASSPPPKR